MNDVILRTHSKECTIIFQLHLKSKEIKVRVEAVKGLMIYLATIEDRQFLTQYNVLFKVMISTMIEAIKFDQDVGRISLEKLCDLVQFNPKFMKPITADLLNIMNEVAKTTTFDDGLRNAALSAIGQLCVCNPVWFR